MKIGILLFFSFFALFFQVKADNGNRYLGFSKKDYYSVKEIEVKIQSGLFGEASSLIDSKIKNEESSFFQAMLYTKRIWLRRLNLQGELVDKNLKELVRVSNAIQPSEQIVIGFDLIQYFCFTGEINRADSVYTKIASLDADGYTFFQKFSSALVNSKRGNLKSALEILESDTSSLTQFENKDELLAQRKLLYSKLLIEYGLYVKADSILKSFSFQKFDNAWYCELKKNQLLGILNLIQKKYPESNSFFLNSISFSEINPQSYDYLVGILGLIESSLRIGNTLDGNNYIRRLQAIALVSAGKREMSEVAYEISLGISFILKGEFSTAEFRLSKASSLLKNSELHPFWNKIQDLKREAYVKTGQISMLTSLSGDLSMDAFLRSSGNSLEFNRRKLQEVIVNAAYNGEYSTSLQNFRTYYTNGISRQIHPDSEERLASLYAFADAFYNTDFSDSAVSMNKIALAICDKNYGGNSAQVLYAKARLVRSLFLNSNYKLGLTELMQLNEKHEEINNAPIALQEKFYLLLAELNKVPGEYELSKKYLNKALSLQHKRVVPDLLLQAEAEEQYAYVYFENSNYYKANVGIERAIKLKRKFLTAESPLLIQPLQQLAQLKVTTGEFQAADAALSPLGKITSAKFGSESVKMAEYKMLLADYLVSISDYNSAKREIEASEKIIKTRLGDMHLSRVHVLVDLAYVLDHLGASASSIKEKYEIALSIVSKTIGIQTPLYMEVNQIYASWLIEQGKLDESSKILSEIEKYWKSKSKDHVSIAQIQKLYGDIAFKSNKFKDAQKYYENSSESYKSLFNERHPKYTELVGLTARMCYANGNTEKALELMDGIIPTFLEFTKSHFSVLSFRQKALYWANIREEFEFYNNLAFLSKSSSPELWSKALNYSIATKGILLSSGSKLLNQVYSSNDTILIAQYNQWVALKEELVSSMGLSKKELAESGIDQNAMSIRIENLEKEMSTRSLAFAEEKSKRNIPDWSTIASILSNDEVVLEIIRLRKFDKSFSDSSVYAVLKFSKMSNKPEMVLFGNGMLMERRYLKYYRNATTGKLDDEFSYTTYWKPIKSSIEDGKRVYVSPDGVYSQINLEMLRFEDGTYSIDHNDFVYVTTTRDLRSLGVEKKSKAKVKKTSTPNYIVCGNPQFYSDEFSGTNKNIASLPGTAKEIEIIKARLDSAGKVSKVYSEASVKEDTLKLMKSPVVLHIATHGMFMEAKQSNKDELASNPLLNSGILLAEAGDILDNKLNPYVNQKNGVLTAFEAMDMQLDNTELVVLSACETGRGEVEAGEGVFGLQRSFLMAGSKAVVVSLFKVNDEVTQKLMDQFYANWLKSGNKEWAFAEAKRIIKKQYKDPIYWGAFILVEGKPERIKN